MNENIVGIRFRNSGKTYCFKADSLDLRMGDQVVVESELGINIGQVAKVRCELRGAPESLKSILRKVTEVDLKQEQENAEVRREAREYAQERIKTRELPMKLLSTDVTLDRKRFIFYFVADTRIDFRELVKDLASKFRTRIELRQIGVRDAAKMIGGLGICGQELCCKTWLKSFAPISIKMAKQQDLVLNTCKLSGLCGRLMCCLNYEYDPNAPKRRKPKEIKREAPELKESRPEPEVVQEPVAPAPPKKTEAAAPQGDAPKGEGDDQVKKKRRRRRGGRKRKKSGDAKGASGTQNASGVDAEARPTSGNQGSDARPPREAQGQDGAEAGAKDKSGSGDAPAQGGESTPGKPARQRKRRWRPRRKKKESNET